MGGLDLLYLPTQIVRQVKTKKQKHVRSKYISRTRIV